MTGTALTDAAGGKEAFELPDTTVSTGPLLNSRQRDLLEVLERSDPRLSCIYYGGLVVLNDGSNPDRAEIHRQTRAVEACPIS